MSTRSVLTWSSPAACSTGPLTQAWIQSVLNSARHFSFIFYFFFQKEMQELFFSSQVHFGDPAACLWRKRLALQFEYESKIMPNCDWIQALVLTGSVCIFFFGVLVSSFPLKQCLNNDLLNFTLKSFSCLLENYVCFSIFCKW